MMLDKIFKELISVVKEDPKYTIGLLSNSGEVMSCSKEEYISNKFDINNSKFGDKFYGINVNNENYGYLWVNGDDENMMIGNLILDSLKTRLLYEIKENSLKKKLTKEDELVKLLLDQKEFNIEKILLLIDELGIDESLPRLAILAHNEKGFDIDEIKGIKLHSDSKSILYSLIDTNNLLLYKDIDTHLDVDEGKKQINTYIESLREWGLDESNFCVGSLQNKLRNYVVSYDNCLWLRNNNYLKQDITIYFNNYLLDYCTSSEKSFGILDIFKYQLSNLDSSDIIEMVEITDNLTRNDYNISKTAQDMYLHKNTLIYKIKKYEKNFRMNIRSSFQGKVLLLLLAQAVKEKEMEKLVGERR